jgi:hypothetical protein
MYYLIKQNRTICKIDADHMPVSNLICLHNLGYKFIPASSNVRSKQINDCAQLRLRIN